MNEPLLPTEDAMYRALVDRDAGYDGVFFAAVTTTGIFCRPTCTARKPRREHVQFFPSGAEALRAGYRPCKLCRPLEPPAAAPEAVRALLAALAGEPGLRLRDAELRARGLEPAALRRWFRKHHGMTFQAYARTLRIGAAFGRIREGDTATSAAFDHGWESLSGFGDAFRRILGEAPTRARGPLIALSRLETPLGPMLAGATDAGVCLLEFVDRGNLETQLARLRRRFRAPLAFGPHPHADRLAGELGAYFAGRLQSFRTPLDLHGTAFQRRAWTGLLDIPYGRTWSYAEQARAIGAAQAVRAVARANGENRIAVAVPCHRVVGADGSLTGYGGGLWRKRWLLDLERRHRATRA